jgi:hypothetical protein
MPPCSLVCGHQESPAFSLSLRLMLLADCFSILKMEAVCYFGMLGYRASYPSGTILLQRQRIGSGATANLARVSWTLNKETHYSPYTAPWQPKSRADRFHALPFPFLCWAGNWVTAWQRHGRHTRRPMTVESWAVPLWGSPVAVSRSERSPAAYATHLLPRHGAKQQRTKEHLEPLRRHWQHKH